MKTSMISPLKTLVLGTMLLFCGSPSAGEVSRALFTIGIDNHEPVIKIDSISSDAYDSISFFTEVNDMTGQTITHQWTHQDKVMFEKTFEVRGERWRIWTSKTLIPAWAGTWTVNVLDDERALLASQSFDYQ